jgi:SpoVK/Ycf46/Vps4 family AAA+-type ATPase
MASAQQLIGLIKSHAEGDEARFYDLAIQLAAGEEQKGHVKLAADLRRWAQSVDQSRGRPGPRAPDQQNVASIAAPRGDLADILSGVYPEERLSELIAPKLVVEELRSVLAETRARTKLEERGFAPRKKLLFSGPPGTGKTMTAKAMAGELKLPLYTIQLHGLISKFYGETASKLRRIFDAMPTTRGVYLFDEIDALAAARERSDDIGEARRVLNSFLQFLEEDSGGSLVIAATNLPHILDRAVLRRFDLTLRYTLPNAEEAAEVIRRRLATLDVEAVKWDKIGAAAQGLGHADLVRVAEDAGRRVVMRDKVKVTDADLKSALVRRRALEESVSADAGAKPAAPRRPRRPRPAVSGAKGKSKKT